MEVADIKTAATFVQVKQVLKVQIDKVHKTKIGIVHDYDWILELYDQFWPHQISLAARN